MSPFFLNLLLAIIGVFMLPSEATFPPAGFEDARYRSQSAASGDSNFPEAECDSGYASGNDKCDEVQYLTKYHALLC
jgi:hypothetical protein